jgi:hypothetical protein
MEVKIPRACIIMGPILMPIRDKIATYALTASLSASRQEKRKTFKLETRDVM